METRGINRVTITKHLVEYQLEMIGRSLMDTLDDDQWYFNFTMTREQHLAFKKYALRLIKKVFKCNTTKALDTFEWFHENLGLRIKN